MASAGSMAEAERRHLFVLFCDIVGSTPLSMRLDAEDLRVVVGAYQRACGAVVLRYDGFLAQYFGDGIEVYFGYPLAHEDDASRVVRCAFEMLSAVQQLAIASKVDFKCASASTADAWSWGPLETATIGAIRLPLAIPRTLPPASRRRPTGRGGRLGLALAASAGDVRGRADGFSQAERGRAPVELFKVVASGGQTAGLNTRWTPFIGRVGERERLREIWARANPESPSLRWCAASRASASRASSSWSGARAWTTTAT